MILGHINMVIQCFNDKREMAKVAAEQAAYILDQHSAVLLNPATLASAS